MGLLQCDIKWINADGHWWKEYKIYIFMVPVIETVLHSNVSVVQHMWSASRLSLVTQSTVLGKVSSGWHKNYINYSLNNQNNTLCYRLSTQGRQYGSGRPTTWIETRKTTNWATYGTSSYILTTATGSQSWWRLPTWSQNVDNKVCYFGCLQSN